MIESDVVHPGAPVEGIKIVVNSLYLSLGFLIKRIEHLSGPDAAAEARDALIENLQNGNIDMAIMEDRKIFDFVLSLAEDLPMPAYEPET
ncbi:MAG TPA: hypothetical protein VNS12_04935 [Pelagibacterium sp.]|uniref:hypothetical protein n=1 Tax=Pelagibacterium sp. TaxID=1967288 RepID=UPI002BDEDD67|nr:hypothetical protein [Pelagibacterium sp.]HWJ87395.1 hypothetical protein [Pelagibacterium sp.]